MAAKGALASIRLNAKVRNGTPGIRSRGLSGHCKSVRPQVHMKCSIWDRAMVAQSQSAFGKLEMARLRTHFLAL